MYNAEFQVYVNLSIINTFFSLLFLSFILPLSLYLFPLFLFVLVDISIAADTNADAVAIAGSVAVAVTGTLYAENPCRTSGNKRE